MTAFDAPEWDKKFNHLFNDIQRENCVVLVGPEAVKIGDRPLRNALRDHLQRSNPDDIAHFYERDGFFLFSEASFSKGDVQREVVLFYKKLQLGLDVPEELLLQLARLRVHLVLSINPDNFLSEVASKYGIEHQSAFFQHGGAGVEEVAEKPTKAEPLFYNLCGSLQQDSSLVLDYDDLFRLLSSLLGSPGLPPKLAWELRQAKHFLFVGFDFDKWYSQLLLRLLSGEKAIRKFAIDASVKTENTTTFLVKQFNIEFVENEQAFLDSFFRRAEAAGLMRDIPQQHGSEALRIAQLLRSGNVLSALEHLRANPRSEQAAVILLAKYRDLKDREARKTIYPQDYEVQYSRIVDAVQEALKTDF
jgi:hypothetical protein